MTVASANDVSGTGSLLARLKVETRSQHARAEAALDLLSPGLTRARYARVLAWQRARHAPLEDGLNRVLRAALPDPDWAALDLEARAKTPRLDLDLRALNQPPLPTLPPPAWLSTEADAWGCAYVLEGATLGGQVVTRHLLGAGVSPDTLHFYRSYGPDVGPRWRTFGALLGARHASAPDPEAFATRAVRAATLTFELFTYSADAPEAP
ncbi:biliverdin-producing heme oxygenase [Deinococcus sp. JMULE3]|uniref:biliverdin-producing heme oxygenase n=1 Tax=Deinococcus sp. JMULE3 TaxID=2518341 RepID=UPI001575F3B9|nr:biliverdin-producing heme oxygenase [Deinococcus sp. JMULE3]NTX98892.1 heme oxygenase [Deinococcus sp. JMULE3]